MYILTRAKKEDKIYNIIICHGDKPFLQGSEKREIIAVFIYVFKYPIIQRNIRTRKTRLFEFTIKDERNANKGRR